MHTHTRRKMSPLLLVAILFSVTSTAMAQTSSTTALAPGSTIIIDPTTGFMAPQGSVSDGGDNGSIAQDLYGVLLIASGLMMAGLGWRGWRITSGLAGFLSFLFISWIAFVNSMPYTGYGSNSDLVVFFATLVVGLVAFGFFAWRFNWGVFIVPIIGGLSIGTWILLFGNDLITTNYYLRWVIISICGVIGGILVFWKRRPAVIVGSAASGSFVFILGLDCFIHSNLLTGPKYIYDQNIGHRGALLHYTLNGTTYGMLIAVGAFAIGSMLLQFLLFKGPFDRTGRSSLEEPSAIEWLRGVPGRRRRRKHDASISGKSHGTIVQVSEVSLEDREAIDYRKESKKRLTALVASEQAMPYDDNFHPTSPPPPVPNMRQTQYYQHANQNSHVDSRGSNPHFAAARASSQIGSARNSAQSQVYAYDDSRLMTTHSSPPYQNINASRSSPDLRGSHIARSSPAHPRMPPPAKPSSHPWHGPVAHTTTANPPVRLQKASPLSQHVSTMPTSPPPQPNPFHDPKRQTVLELAHAMDL